MTTKVPIILSDIDGVLKTGSKPLSQAAVDTLKIVRSPLSKIDPKQYGSDNQLKLPFVLFTNRGGMTELEHSDYFNNAMGFDDEENHKYRVTEEQNVLNISAIKAHFKEFEDKLILIVGDNPHLEKIANYYGAKKCITKEEYLLAYPDYFPLTGVNQENKKKGQEHLKQKLGLTDEDLKEPLQCHAVFILTMPAKWEQEIQLILDFLSTEDGKVTGQITDIENSKHIPIYVSYNDITFRHHYPLPRIVNGCFISSLKAVYKEIYKRDLDLEIYGKPEIKQFEYAKQAALNQLHSSLLPSNIYMIGDNPQADIQGANKMGWVSILVRCGLFRGKDNDKEFPATYVVEDFKEAIQLIFKLEGISNECFE